MKSGIILDSGQQGEPKKFVCQVQGTGRATAAPRCQLVRRLLARDESTPGPTRRRYALPCVVRGKRDVRLDA